MHTESKIGVFSPLTKIRAIEKLKKSEIEAGIEDSAGSWHNDYKDSAYIFVGWSLVLQQLQLVVFNVVLLSGM